MKIYAAVSEKSKELNVEESKYPSFDALIYSYWVKGQVS